MTDTKKSDDIPVTKKMLEETRDELKHDISSLSLKMDARFDEVDARFNKVDARFSEVDARFNEVDARFDEVDARFNEVDGKLNQVNSKLEQVLAAVNRVSVLVEDQNSRNRYVLDGYQSLHDRQNALEQELRTEVADIKAAIAKSNVSN